MEKQKDKIKKQEYCIEKIKHNQARQVDSHSLPHSTQKYKPTFSPNVPTFRDFLPCFISNLPTPHKFPFNPTRRTRAYAYIRARALSEFAIFAFTLHLHPQFIDTVHFVCEGNALFLPSPVKEKGVKPSPTSRCFRAAYSRMVKR